jgi:hypothetical protein
MPLRKQFVREAVSLPPNEAVQKEVRHGTAGELTRNSASESTAKALFSNVTKRYLHATPAVQQRVRPELLLTKTVTVARYWCYAITETTQP